MLTLKYAPERDKFSWQVSCPYHRKNNRTGCKKTFACDTSNCSFEVASHRVLMRLRHWANQAQRHDRQRHHRGFNALPDTLPTEALINAQMLSTVPDVVPTDAELDGGETSEDGSGSERIADPGDPSCFHIFVCDIFATMAQVIRRQPQGQLLA